MKLLATALLALLLVPAQLTLAQEQPATTAGEKQSQESTPGSPAQPFKFTKVDLELLEKSNLLDRDMREKGMVYAEPALTEYVSAVGNDVLPAASAPENVTWRFFVLRDPVPNAFALPNGSIYVNTGLLALLENEAQLASVLAHEEAHVLDRHSYLANRSYRKKAVAAHIFAAAGAIGAAAGGAGGAAAYALGRLAPTLLEASVYGYSRELEKNADVHAIGALVQADYSAEEMVNSFRLLAAGHEVDLSQVFYQDHPKLKDRIAYTSELVNSTHAVTAHPRVEPERYLKATESAARHNVDLDIHAGRARTAVAVAQRLTKQNSKSSANFCALGDAFRSLGPRTREPSPEELSSHGKNETRKKLEKLTEQEYAEALMSAPNGKVNWEANAKQAQDAYATALELNPDNAAAHRGLGFLYEGEHLPVASADEFRNYLELAANASDQSQIRRHLEANEKEAAKVAAPQQP